MTGLGKPKGPNAPSLAEEGRRFLIWSRTSGDREAAIEAGMPRGSWIVWRIRRKLPPKGDRGSEFLAAWRKARSDGQAAEILGIKVQVFSRWRKNHDLPPCRGNPKVRLASGRLMAPVPPKVRHGTCSACGKQTTFYPGQDPTKTCGNPACIRARKSAGGRAHLLKTKDFTRQKGYKEP